jgi:hypothetical protein
MHAYAERSAIPHGEIDVGRGIAAQIPLMLDIEDFSGYANTSGAL